MMGMRVDHVEVELTGDQEDDRADGRHALEAAGAALGGFLVGVISVSLQAYLPVELRPYRDAFVFGLFILFLFWRPDGLLMSRADRERV